MNPMLMFALKRNLESINDLVEYCNFSIFDNSKGPSCFEILIQFLVDFKYDYKIMMFLKKHTKKEEVNLVEKFLMSPLVKKINTGERRFYEPVKNIFRHLNSIQKVKTNYSTMIKTFDCAFKNYPKDAVSLMKYMSKKHMLDNVIKKEAICDIMITSHKVFRWILSYTMYAYTRNYFVKIVRTFFQFVVSQECGYDLTKYLTAFKDHKELFTDQRPEDYDNIVMETILDMCDVRFANTKDNEYEEYDECYYLSLKCLLLFFEEIFGYTLSENKIIELITYIQSSIIKYEITLLFKKKIELFSKDKQQMLYNKFLLDLPEDGTTLTPLIQGYFKMMTKLNMDEKEIELTSLSEMKNNDVSNEYYNNEFNDWNNNWDNNVSSEFNNDGLSDWNNYVCNIKEIELTPLSINRNGDIYAEIYDTMKNGNQGLESYTYANIDTYADTDTNASTHMIIDNINLTNNIDLTDFTSHVESV